MFPFSYTTHDKELALGAKLLQAGGGAAGAISGSSTPQQDGGFSDAQAASLANLNGKSKGGVMDSTMADIDGALAGLRTTGGGGDDTDSAEGIGNPRASIHSERTADLNEDDDEISDEGGINAANGNQYQSATAARSALAENAKKNLNSQSEKEKLEEMKRREKAERLFQEEEERQRELLLKREEERQIKVREGTLNASSNNQPKVAPAIAKDVEMSDESESEDEEQVVDNKFKNSNSFIGDDTVPITHSPLFGDNNQHDLTSKALDSNNEGGLSTSGRTLSPIPSASNHTSTQDTIQQQQQHSSYQAQEAATGRSSVAKTYDERSIDSSRGGRGSMADSINNNGTGTAATSVAALPPNAAGSGSSPAPSVRGNAPGGDPHDWSVEQVVEWGRSKGWDENSVVSKFVGEFFRKREDGFGRQGLERDHGKDKRALSRKTMNVCHSQLSILA